MKLHQLAAAAVALVTGVAVADLAVAGPTVEAIKKRGTIRCGVSPSTAGFSIADSQGVSRGFDADKCRAVAAAMFGDANKVDFVPKVKMEIVVGDELVDKALTAIVGAAKTGQVGDGKIFVTNLAEVVRVRTGETGAAAI